MKKLAFYTLGCKLNFAESSTIARSLEPMGFERVEFQQSPDLFVINTCSVTDQADKKCKKVVKEAKNVSTLNISELANGLYFIQVSTDKGNSTQKFIKQ